MSIRGSLTRRNSGPSDWPDIESVYAGAFPDEDLLPVVRELLEVPEIATSLVAEIESRAVGHVMFSTCAIEGTEIEVSLLAPLAVAPEWHGQGIGSDLVRYGLRRLSDEGVHLVCVLGDPAFYGRLGFEPERSIRPPYPLPDEWADAWQSVGNIDPSTPQTGTIRVPAPWQKPEYWAP